MIVNKWVSYHLKMRRERKKMEAAGYRMTEVDSRLHRSGLEHHRLEDVRISHDGKHVWYKISNQPIDFP